MIVCLLYNVFYCVFIVCKSNIMLNKSCYFEKQLIASRQKKPSIVIYGNMSSVFFVIRRLFMLFDYEGFAVR